MNLSHPSSLFRGSRPRSVLCSRHILSAVAWLLLLTLIAPIAPRGFAQGVGRGSRSRETQATAFVEGQLLVKFEAGAAVRNDVAYQTTVTRFANEVHAAVGAQSISRYLSNWELVRLPQGMSVRTAMDTYRRTTQRVMGSFVSRPGATAAESRIARGIAVTTEPNGYILIPNERPTVDGHEARPRDVQAGKTPNDPVFPELARYRVIKGPEAWAVTTGSDQIVAVVNDGAVDYNHVDLRANIWTGSDGGHGYNTCTGSTDPGPADDHGTHVAGIIGEVGNNGIGGGRRQLDCKDFVNQLRVRRDGRRRRQ